MGFFNILLSIACNSVVVTSLLLPALSSKTTPSSISSDIGNPWLPSDIQNLKHSSDFPVFTEKPLRSSTERPAINPEYAAKDCTSWINPLEYSDIPSAFTKLPAVISVSDITTNESFSLAITDKYGEQLVCLKVTVQNPMSHVSVYFGQCGESEPVIQDLWLDLTEPSFDTWPCLVKPHFSLSEYFHIEIEKALLDSESKNTTVSFRLNGDIEKSLTLPINSSAEFVYIFATKIKTGVNLVYFRDSYMASKCQTLDEPIGWEQTGYFLPEEDSTEVKMYISYCHFTEVLTYKVSPKDMIWHALSFQENSVIAEQENIFFYRDVLVDDKVIGNLTTTVDFSPLLRRLIIVCPLKVAKISMTNAIWSNRCNVSDILIRRNSEDESLVNSRNSSCDETEQRSCRFGNSVLNANMKYSISSDKELNSSLRPAINQEHAAKDCSPWTNPEDDSDIPSAFTMLPAVISVSDISLNSSFHLAIVDKYGDQFACFVAIAGEQETYVSLYRGGCKTGELITEKVWPKMIEPKHDHWPCLVKPQFSLQDYYHIEIDYEENRTGGTVIYFRQNGESEEELSTDVNSQVEFVYIFASKIKTGVNMVYFRDGYTASKCQTLDETIDWHQTSYFLPQKEANQVKIYISYCRFTEVKYYQVNPKEHKWHKLSFSEDPADSAKENVIFHKNVLIDDTIFGNVTQTTDQPPQLFHLLRFCPFKEARVSMINAIWTHKCNPKNIM